MTYMKKRTEYIAPEKLLPPHGVEEPKKLDRLIRSMEKKGWIGRPLVGLDEDQNVIRLWTGSHRLAAALAAGLETVPVVLVTEEELAAAMESDWWDHRYGWPTDAERLSYDLEEFGFRPLADLLIKG